MGGVRIDDELIWGRLGLRGLGHLGGGWAHTGLSWKPEVWVASAAKDGPCRVMVSVKGQGEVRKNTVREATSEIGL